MKIHPTTSRARLLAKAVLFAAAVSATPFVKTAAGEQIAAGFYELQKLEARETTRRTHAARPRQAYVSELARTHELFEQALREGLEAPGYRVTLALLCSQAAVLDDLLERIVVAEADERRALATGPHGELWMERMDESAARAASPHTANSPSRAPYSAR